MSRTYCPLSSIPRAKRLFERARKWREGCPMRKTAMGRAVDYLLAREDDLMECLLQPGSRIDNNLVENAIRLLKLGLKNYLFIGHPNAGSTFACMYTLVENCPHVILFLSSTDAEIEFADRREIDQIVDLLEENGYGFRSQIHAVTQSDIFLSK